MCGRYVAPDGTLIEGVISERTWIKTASMFKLPGRPNYNVAPTQFVPIITANGIFDARFGLTPVWDKQRKFNMINAMTETLTEKKTFKPLLQSNRCLVPVMGYYEWKVDGSAKIPYYFSLKRRKVFMFAGLYNEFVDVDGEKTHTFTIITTESNSLQKPIHNRMPAILAENEEELWLTGGIDEALGLLGPFPSNEMQLWQVDKAVGNPRNNKPELIEAV